MIRLYLSLLMNLAIVVWTVLSVRQTVRRKDPETERTNGARAYRYFTTDSNVLSAVSALVVLQFGVRSLGAGVLELPVWAVLFKYMGAVSVAVTLLTVLVFLGPTQGYPLMFAEEGLYLHLIGPLLAIVSFCLLETGTDVTWAQTLLGLLPTFLYGTVYLILVVKIGANQGGWDDFYGFNRGGKWIVSYIAMHGGTYGIALLLRLLHNL